MTQATTPVAKAALATRWESAMAPNYGTPTVQLARGVGSHLWDADGKRYTDLLAGIAVNIVGHAHPAIVAAVQDQIAALGHTSNLYAHEPGLKLAERLQRYAGGHQVIYQNSGTEANEAALKLVRRHAHAQGIPDGVVVAFQHGFHGRTMGAVTLTGQPHYQERFAPLVPQIVHVPFNDPAALESVFAQQKVAGVFFESVQGEGGVLPMTTEFAVALSRQSQRNNALLVADEIQTGVGRTGKFFGFEHDGLKPQVITLAKGLGGGLPLGAMLVAPKEAKLFEPGAHGTTFGGNPVCCAASNAALDVLEKEHLTARAAMLGNDFMAAIREEGCSIGLPARGRGLLIGIPLAGPKAPDVVKALASRSYLVGQAGKNVVRVAPALNIPESDLMGSVKPIVQAIAANR